MIPSIGLLILEKWAPSPLTCIYSSCISFCVFLYYLYCKGLLSAGLWLLGMLHDGHFSK
jgi:hypothetical protein